MASPFFAIVWFYLSGRTLAACTYYDKKSTALEFASLVLPPSAKDRRQHQCQWSGVAVPLDVGRRILFAQHQNTINERVEVGSTATVVTNSYADAELVIEDSR